METKHKANLAILALIAAGLLAVPLETQAQALPENRENYAWITNTNGVTWKMEINPDGGLHFVDSKKQEIAQIVVPKHAIINRIDAVGCVNLTNIVFQPGQARKYGLGDYSGVLHDTTLNIIARGTSLRNITCSKEMINHINVERESQAGGWWPLQWTELFPWDKFEPPKLEIRTQATANGTEVEVVWRDGKLQIADAVSGEYRDHLGSSPLRFPLAAAKNKQFFRIARIESPTTEEPPTPQTSGGVR